jgi:hypothetical protein
MSTLPVPRPPRKPSPSPAAAEPEWHWLIRPHFGRGYLEINETVYQLTEVQFEYENGMAGRLWQVAKSDGTVYQLTSDRDGELSCDCPDATYRQRACKHVAALVAALAELDRAERLRLFLAPELDPADPPF